MATSLHPMRQFFAYEHLPEHLRAAGMPFAEVADSVTGCITNAAPKMRELVRRIEREFPANPESTWAQTKLQEAERMVNDFCLYPVGHHLASSLDDILRKLLEAKDCAVRALLFKAVQP